MLTGRGKEDLPGIVPHGAVAGQKFQQHSGRRSQAGQGGRLAAHRSEEEEEKQAHTEKRSISRHVTDRLTHTPTRQPPRRKSDMQRMGSRAHATACSAHDSDSPRR
jgi:hypothetical protein